MAVAGRPRTVGLRAGTAPPLFVGRLTPVPVLLLGLAGRQAGDMDGIRDRVVGAPLRGVRSCLTGRQACNRHHNDDTTVATDAAATMIVATSHRRIEVLAFSRSSLVAVCSSCVSIPTSLCSTLPSLSSTVILNLVPLAAALYESEPPLLGTERTRHSHSPRRQIESVCRGTDQDGRRDGPLGRERTAALSRSSSRIASPGAHE